MEGGSQSWIWPNLRSLVQNFFILVYELRNSSRMFWKAIIFIEQLPFLKFKAVFLEGKYSRILKNVLRSLYLKPAIDRPEEQFVCQGKQLQDLYSKSRTEYRKYVFYTVKTKCNNSSNGEIPSFNIIITSIWCDFIVNWTITSNWWGNIVKLR